MREMNQSQDAIIEIRHLQKTFGDHEVLSDINLSVRRGEVVSIIGSSGSGKSTMLRCVNLLETPSGGEILFHGKDITSRDVDLRKYRAKVGMVFQQFNLFNNMTALQNCMVGQPRVLGRKPEEAKKIAMEYLTKVGMAQYINAKPRQLSGGQKQRVAAHDARGHSVCRADECARPRDGGRGALGHEAARRGGFHHAGRHARDELCARCFRPRDFHGQGHHR